jgi:hypothetical protein
MDIGDTAVERDHDYDARPRPRMLHVPAARLNPRRGLPYLEVAMLRAHAATLSPVLTTPRQSRGCAVRRHCLSYLEVAVLHAHTVALSLVLTTPRQSRGHAVPWLGGLLSPARSRHQRLPGFSPRLGCDWPKVLSRRSIHARDSRHAYTAVSAG